MRTPNTNKKEKRGAKAVLKLILKKYKIKLVKFENPIPGRNPGVITLKKIIKQRKIKG